MRAQALLHDLDRSISSVRFRLALTRWLYLPTMLLALVVMVVGLVLGFGTTGPVLGGIIGIAGAAAGFSVLAQKQEGQLAELVDERDDLLEEFPELERGSPPALRDR